MKLGNYTFSFFNRPSFLNDISRTLDLFGQYDEYNLDENPEETDAKAIASDWLAVYDDINSVILKGK